MSHAVKMGIIWAIIYIIIELTLITLDLHRNPMARFIGFGSNTLCLLLAIGISIVKNFKKFKHQGLSLVSDLKTGIKTGVVYALIISSFLFSYYKWIDPGYQEFEEDAIDAKKIDKGLSSLSEKDLRDNAQINIDQMLSIKTVFPMSLMALLMLSILYSFLITAFNRMVLAKLD
jgi:hypothetical protein